jgi:peptidoglycan/LPS O-acetylase OafA/YrhL
MLLSKYTASRDNNFNLIRFLAASLVLISHSYPIILGLGAQEPLVQSLGISLGSIAVDVFFIASGFFIAASFNYKSSLKSFVMARLLRIYPALIVTVLLSTFVLGLYFTSLTFNEYLSNNQTYRYLLKNITLISGVEYYLPEVFKQNPYPNAVNGSLWTLPYEIKMYCFMMMFISLFSLIERKMKSAGLAGVLIIGLTFFALITYILNHFYSFYEGQSLKLFTMFFMGSAFFYLKERVSIRSKFGIPVIIAFGIAMLSKDIFFVIYTLLLPYLVFYLAYIPAGKIRSFNKLGDYSYGIYIYAFPIQQMVAALIPNCGIYQMISLSFLGTIIMAYLSWHLIEERALKLKR